MTHAEALERLAKAIEAADMRFDTETLAAGTYWHELAKAALTVFAQAEPEPNTLSRGHKDNEWIELEIALREAWEAIRLYGQHTIECSDVCSLDFWRSASAALLRTPPFKRRGRERRSNDRT